MRFRRKKDEEEVISGEVVPEEGGDPSAWALPADAAVTAGDDAQGDTVDMEAVAPATAAGGAAREDDHGERTTDESTTLLEQAVGDEEPGATSSRAADEAESHARVEPETTVSGASFTSPGLGADAEPRAVAAADRESWASGSAASGGASSGASGFGSSGGAGASGFAGGGAGSGGAGAGSGGAPGGPLASVLAHPKVQERPEIAVAGAFAGAFVLAKILKAITSPE